MTGTANPLTVGDTSPALAGTVNASAVGAAGELHFRKPDGTKFTGAAAFGTYDATAGVTPWSYDWADGDLSVDGQWKVELQVTFSNQKKQTFGPVRFYVQPQMA